MDLTRRDALKSATVAVAMASAGTSAAEAGAGGAVSAPRSGDPSVPPVSFPLKVRERLLLDFGWRFHLGHACDPDRDFCLGKLERTFAKTGRGIAECCDDKFDDSKWEAVDLPHDWLMALASVPTKNPPPPKVKDFRAAHSFKPVGRYFPETSIGWYRRILDVTEADRGKCLSLEFDGVYRDAMVVVNGHMVCRHPGGTGPFRVDISDCVDYGKRNVLCVRADASLSEGWFYEGAGIYRHVWLVKTAPVYIPQWGTWVRSDVRGKAATLTLTTEISNDALTPAECRLISDVYDPAGKLVATLKTAALHLGSEDSRSVTQQAVVNAPALWSVKTPRLYHVVSRIEVAGKVVDDFVTSFGIRTIRFDADKGFLLNGEPVKIQGTANHQDHAGVGVAMPDYLHDWRIRQLRAMGCNGYRITHNEGSDELLDACDRHGMLVMDEARLMSSDADNQEEFIRTLKRDRNHPSIILWAVGNEEPLQGTERGIRMAKVMKNLVRSYDPTRPITECNHETETWGIGITALMDVQGCNYTPEAIPAFHAKFPHQPVLGTEMASTVSTRGFYTKDPESGYCVAYDIEFPEVASTAEHWMKIIMPADYIAGGYVWSGFDYHGEPTPYNWFPSTGAQFGILDMCGFPKDNFYYYKAWWSAEPVLHLLPHWNWKPGEMVRVWCHSNLDTVELFLNGKSVGTREVPRYGHAEWDVAFAPGVIEARGYRGGKLILKQSRETVGEAARIQLTAERSVLRADGEDVAIVTAAVVDNQNRPVPGARNNLGFTLSGPGKIIGVGNGDPKSLELDKAEQRTVFDGLCQILIRTTHVAGDLVLTATSAGLQDGAVAVAAKTVPARPYVL